MAKCASAADADEHPRTRAERRDQQVQRILDAAKICFVRSGFQGASMQQICAEAGMSPGALYRYFSSKEAIIEAICEADRAEDAKLFASILQQSDRRRRRGRRGDGAYRHMHETHAAPLFAEICAESMRNEAVGRTCLENMEQVLDVFRGYLGGAIERGEIDPPVDLETLLHTMMAIAHGMALNDLPSLGVPFDKLEILVARLVEGMLRPTNKSSAG